MGANHYKPCAIISNFDPVFKKVSDVLYNNNKIIL